MNDSSKPELKDDKEAYVFFPQHRKWFNKLELSERLASPDPNYNILIPIWADDKKPLDSYVELGYTFIESFDDADGFLEIPRIGFMVK